MAPTLITSYFVNATANGTTALVTPSFTPAVGELIVVKLQTEDSSQTATAATDTQGNTYLPRITVTTGSHTYARISTAFTAAATAMTVSSGTFSNGTGFAHKSMVVERWSGAQLAATPAVNGTTTGSGTATTGITTVAANSVVSWCDGDWAAVAPGTPTYASSATQESIDNQSTTFYVGYYAWQNAVSAGSQTFGVTSPTGQTWTLAAIEIQDAGGGGGTALPIPRRSQRFFWPGKGPHRSERFHSTKLDATIPPATAPEPYIGWGWGVNV